MAAAGSISIRRVYAADEGPDGGKRILVDRLWPRGIRKDQLGADEWLRDLGPSDELRKWFAHESRPLGGVPAPLPPGAAAASTAGAVAAPGRIGRARTGHSPLLGSRRRAQPGGGSARCSPEDAGGYSAPPLDGCRGDLLVLTRARAVLRGKISNAIPPPIAHSLARSAWPET